VLPADTAADLYTTYGFPLDLTEVICREASFTVDLEGAERIVKGAAEADGPIDPNAALDPVFHQLKAEAGQLVFTGYEREDGESEIVALVAVERSEGGRATRRIVERAEAGAELEIVVRQTPFYAESGGQVGDVGHLRTSAGAEAKVVDVQRPLPGLVVHAARLEQGSLAKGEP
jgi:alanyl-tRNA synthetase